MPFSYWTNRVPTQLQGFHGHSIKEHSQHHFARLRKNLLVFGSETNLAPRMGFWFFSYLIPSKEQWKGISQSCKYSVSFSLDYCLCWYLPAELLGGDFQNIRSVPRYEHMHRQWEDMPRLLLLGAPTFTSLGQQSCACPRSPYPAWHPPAPVTTAPVDGTRRRKVMRRNTAKLLALLPFLAQGDGSLPHTTCTLPQEQASPWLATHPGWHGPDLPGKRMPKRYTLSPLPNPKLQQLLRNPEGLSLSGSRLQFCCLRQLSSFAYAQSPSCLPRRCN